MSEQHHRSTWLARPRVFLPAALVLIVVTTLIGAVLAFEPQVTQQVRRTTPVITAEIVRELPHDKGAFCQGLLIHDGVLYESTGLYGESSLRRVDLETGGVKKIRRLDNRLFGEGLASHGEHLYQLTWKAGVGFIYDRKTLNYVGRFRYRGEGWGLTSDGKQLILSNGSSTLQFLDPKNFRVTGNLTVRDGNRIVNNLNELEFIDDVIYANVWFEDRIAMISPETGEVLSWIDCSELLPAEHRREEEVLNGIAYDKVQKRLYITGKNWPKLFEIRVVE
ncbi:glutaminyl-peptide cyclotransferase [Calycomorphotria hydatis]|uniref:Glutamine cyclotransferase n=1 Tax=Calycomorphotria hydatis TaxID=2528027 RepID=A0A517T947_9PLAN|nr:glutaminyl-peptide cyclotransferase [Calycomorphotria hydatis]QDT64879.1 Glutamine cyclotransferase [Calycomorphotria hydatis]